MNLFPTEPSEDTAAVTFPTEANGALMYRPPSSSFTAQMIALTQAPDVESSVLTAQKQNVEAAQALLEQNQEFTVRTQLAVDRASRSMRGLDNFRREAAAMGPGFDPNVTASINDAYNRVAAQQVEDSARTSLELETVERVQDRLATDPVEARVIWGLYDRGNAQRVQHEEAAKNLIIAQRLQEVGDERDNEGWGSWTLNFLTSLIPTNYNFSRTGIVEGSPNGFMSWLLTGTGLQTQARDLWNMPLDEFSRQLSRDGDLMRSLRDNATTFGLYNPATAHDVLTALNYQTESDRLWANTWGVIEPATVIPWGKITSLPSALTRMGSRRAATGRVAEALRTMGTEGPDAARAITGVSEREVVENIELTAINPNASTPNAVPLSVDVDTHLKAAEAALADMPTIVQVSRANSADELAEAYTSRVRDLEAQMGRSAKDVRFMFEDVATGSTYAFNDVVPEQGNVVSFVEFTIGNKAGGGFANEAVAKGAATRLGIGNVETFRDVSGQFFAKGRVNVREEGFFSNPLQTPDHSALGALRSDARRADRTQQQKAVAAGSNAEVVARALRDKVTTALRPLNRAQKESLDAVIRVGGQESRWFNPQEFDILYERAYGQQPTDAIRNAYSEFRLANDIDFTLRNNEMYKESIVRGYESTKFKAMGRDFDIDGVVDYRLTNKPAERIYNASEGVHYVGDTTLTSERFKQFAADGYVMVKPREAVELADGTVVSRILVRKSEIEISPLRRRQLAYSEGGHRAYKGTYFAKQARKGKQADTGSEYLLNPNVFITGNSRKAMVAWADDMNAAIARYTAGERDVTVFDDIFAGRAGFPSGDEFVRAMDEGKIGTEAIEIVGDRELPAIYTAGRDDVAAFVDAEESALSGYYRTTGQMYYSKKGEALRDWTGDYAETLDPWETLNTALYNITRNTSLNNYKMSTLERFRRTYGDALALRDVDTASPYAFLEAKPKTGIDPKLAERIQAEQGAIKRVLNFETGLEKTLRHRQRQLAEWVEGNVPGRAGEAGRDFVHWLGKNNPVQFLRSLAFDAKLGMFNLGQLFIQTSTMLAATAMSPRNGMRGMMSAIPMVAYTTSRGSGAVLDQLAKNGVWRMSGFESPEAFKEYAKFVNKTGFMYVGNTHLLINSYGPNRVFGAAKMVDTVREYGRVFFYQAEQLNRATAARIAYGELMEAGLRPGSAEFRERFMGLADDYSFNMLNESSASFQHGLWSVPTQFWAYNMRMMDAMFGKRFTGQQRTRLILSQLGLFGAGGVPVLDAINDYRNKARGESVPIESLEGVFDRGAVDLAVKSIFDADVRVSERMGTGQFLTDTFKDIFSMGEYGEKSAAEMIAGATGSIMWQASGTMKDLATYALAESGGDTGRPLTNDSLLRLAMEVSTFSNATKAMMVRNYGVFLSKKGAVQAQVPTQDAFFVALGLRPQEVEEASTMMAYTKSRDDEVAEVATQIRNWRTEAFYNPDKYEENMDKVNAFVGMLDPQIRDEALRRTNSATPQSFYDYVKTKYDEERLTEEAYGRANR